MEDGLSSARNHVLVGLTVLTVHATLSQTRQPVTNPVPPPPPHIPLFPRGVNKNPMCCGMFFFIRLHNAQTLVLPRPNCVSANMIPPDWTGFV